MIILMAEMGNGRPTILVLALGCLIAGAPAGCSNSPSSGLAGSAGLGGGSPMSTAGTNGSGISGDQGTQVGATTDVTTKLPALPPLNNVFAELNDDSAKITFDPVDGALDYRVYELPADSDIDIRSSGQIVVKNGTYRCAGNRETPPTQMDSAPDIQSDAVRTQVDNQKVGNYLRTLADSTLGYVYPAPGPNLIPVYALGDPDGTADVTCYFARWAASRVKQYTTSADERDALLAASARDDGVAFYVPAHASASTKQVYVSSDQPNSPYESRYYLVDGPEADLHTTKAKAFLVETAPAPNLQPLKRVFYLNGCGRSHDELAMGSERFNRIYKQGDQLPFWSLLWTGVTAPTTLVVEALSSGCPYPGHLSPESFASFTADFGDLRLVHEPFITMDQARAASATAEVFVNGQHGPAWIWQGERLSNGMQPASAPAPLPKAVARSFIKVKPTPHPKMDFFADFAPGSKLETFVSTPCDTPMDCFASTRSTSASWDQMWTETQLEADNKTSLSTFGQVNGELWVTYADAGADTNGKFRLTAKQKATMNDTNYLHVTMEANGYSTSRRYPQFLITDRDAPVQFRLAKGHTIIVQTIGEIGAYIFPIDYQIELCKLRDWDVNNQCPAYDLHHIPGINGGPLRLAPNAEVGELTSADQRLIFDAYLSTKRVYLFLDHKPYACADLPADAAPSGPVTVTFGDVLYHSAVDTTYSFEAAHLQIDTSRHFDNLGFSSGVAAPGWDESVLPCVAPITL